MRLSDSHRSRELRTVRQSSFELMDFRLSYSDRTAGARPRMNTALNVYPKIILAALKLLRCHEFDSHNVGAVGNRLFKLEVSGAVDRLVSKFLQLIRQRKRLGAQPQYVEHEVDVFCCPRTIYHELHCLCA